MDRKTACSIFALQEDASMEDIERAYDILLRRKMQQQREGKDETEDVLFQKYTEAYNYLKGDTGRKKQGIGSRIFNFFLYYKTPIIVAVIILIFAAAIVRQSFFPEKTDLNIQICGEVHPQELGLDALGKNIRAGIPEFGSIRLGVTPLKHNAEDTTSLTNSNKIFVDLSIGKLDVFIMDQYLYEKYASLGIFMDLGAAADEMSVPVSQREGLYARAKNDASDKLYGIDVTKSQVLSVSGIAGDRKILVILDRSTKKDNALKLLRLLLPEDPAYKAATPDPG
jgi:hypothetical protein